MYAARHVCFTTPFFGCGGVRSMRRGGNHAARRNTAALDVAGAARCLFCIVGRGLDLRPKGRRCAAVGHLRAKSRALRPGCAPKRRCGASPKRACGRRPRRTDTIFKNVQCAAGVNARPTMRRIRSCFPQTPRGEHPCREAYMPPLQTPGTAYTNPKNVAMRRTPTGRMHAAPTDRPGTAGEWVKQVFTACRPRRGQDPALQSGGNGRFSREPRAGHTPAGRHVCLPYKHPVPRTRTRYVSTGQTSTGRMHAAPTDRPETAGEQVRKVFAACRPRLRTGREQQTNR